MFIIGISNYASLVFSLRTMLAAVLPAIKIFNYAATLHKSSITFETPMFYASGFMGLFTIGGLTGVFLASLGMDIHMTETYPYLPQFILGYLGMPRRYHAYPAELQMLNVLSTAGATILGIGSIMPLLYLSWSLKCGAIAGNNSWQATGLEWQLLSPPVTHNSIQVPTMDHEAYGYEWLEHKQAQEKVVA